MNNHDPDEKLSRRGMLTGMATFALSLTSVGALASSIRRGTKWDSKYEAAINFEIDQPDGVRYHRPYVAVWLENKEGKAVRTLSLWVQTTRRGPRWIPDLRRWYRDEQDRKAANGGDLVETISSATRMPGKYTLVWNGMDDAGKPVDQGDYYVCIEAAREHGTYQLIRKSFTFTNKAFKQKLEGNLEIKEAEVEFRKRK
ncbi:MAG: hypothetical protein BGO01_10830 [Armatimonadetes bacterium 55-13]|nr:DUF2271 domain-containing protein [Armatimonadota bacterium]OJU62886.1 MAG: hypothetical protein BGO01_10830 [Armatimonadetes bacterium 55-13]